MRHTITLTLLSLAPLLLLPQPAHCAGTEASELEPQLAAQKLFEAGDALYESKRYEEAAQAFRQSHSLVKSPNSRLMLARSLREKGAFDEARIEFKGTIDDAVSSAGRYPEAQKAAAAELLAMDNVTSTAPTATERKPESQHPATVTPRSEVQPPTAGPPTSSPKPPSSTMRTAAWASVGVAAAGGIGFTVFGLLNRSAYRELQQTCNSGECTSDPSSRKQEGQTYQLLTNVSLGVFCVGAAAATTLFLLSPTTTDKRSIALQVSPGTVLFRGQF